MSAIKWAISAKIPINENDAIATGISSSKTDCRINCPIPGHGKIVSVRTAPSIIVTIVNINDVTTERKENLAAWQTLNLIVESH